MLLDFFPELLNGYPILVAIWLITIIIVLITLFRRKNTAMPAKVWWAVAIIFAPVIGLIFYLLLGLSKRKKLLEVDKQNI